MSETLINPNQIRDGSSTQKPYLLANNTGLLSKVMNINGYMGASSSYIEINNLIETQSYKSWSLEIIYTHCYEPTNITPIIGQDTQDLSGITFQVSDGFFKFNLLNNNNQWIVADQTTGIIAEKGKTYFFKFGYDGTKLYVDYKSNASDQYSNVWNTNSVNNYQKDKFCVIGSKYYAEHQSPRYNSSIISDFKFIGDGNIIFDLTTAVEGTDFINVGCSLISNNYDIILE